MNRRPISTAAVIIGGVVVLAIVAVVAFAAGAATGGRGGIGWMRDGMDHAWFGGMGGFGGFGWGLGWLVMLLLVVGIVWAAVSLLRPSEPGPPRYGPPPGQPTQGLPPGTGPQPGETPNQGPPPGSAEAFEAWHRQAHAADGGGAQTTHVAPAPGVEPPPTQEKPG